MIIWRKKAKRQLDAMLSWLADEVSQQAAFNLLLKVRKTAEKVYKEPTIGKPSLKFKTIRSYRIDSNRRLFYSMKGRTLFVVEVFDSRQDPKKMKY